ncbi:ribonuclease III domain-containing protein [Xylariomycetidae sp. FL2044]|nr:ribonuclease III domain-containing protein [Xylariomycetidae sp. FL2044]
MEKARQIQSAMAIIGYDFVNTELLWEALQAAGNGTVICNKRYIREGNKSLAAIGDKILGLLIVKEGYYRQDRIGVIAIRTAEVCSNERLATICDDTGLTECIKGNPSQGRFFVGGKTKAASIEAIIGAVYLDGGLDAARAVMQRIHPLCNNTPGAQAPMMEA